MISQKKNQGGVLMFNYLMLLYISYKHGKRYAFLGEFPHDLDEIQTIQEHLETHYGDIGMSLHYGHSKTSDIKDVMKSDSYYKDIVFIDNKELFIELIKESEIITPLDIAKLMANKVECTPLKLQKLLYIAYCKYLKKYDNVMFDEAFEAWKYGPVIKSVYYQFKHKREKVIVDVPTANEKRYLTSSIGRKKLSVVEETINEFGHLTAKELVDLTHEEGRAWEKVYNCNGPRKEITIEYIKESKDYELV